MVPSFFAAVFFIAFAVVVALVDRRPTIRPCASSGFALIAVAAALLLVTQITREHERVALKLVSIVLLLSGLLLSVAISMHYVEVYRQRVAELKGGPPC
jgi:hypothetical protein